MSADRVVAGLLRIAKEDVEAARLLAPSGNRNAIYLCEQAAEKVIRAVLTSEGVHAGIGHRLDEFVDRVPDENPLKPALRDLEELAAFATAYRYVGSAGRIPVSPSAQELYGFVSRVQRALDLAVEGFGVDLNDPNQAAKSPKPLRAG
jgi:HEPN domain-containing protein